MDVSLGLQNSAHHPDLAELDPHDDGVQGSGGDVRETFQQSSHLLLSVDFLIPRSKLEAVLHVEVEKDYEADELMGERGAVP